MSTIDSEVERIDLVVSLTERVRELILAGDVEEAINTTAILRCALEPIDPRPRCEVCNELLEDENSENSWCPSCPAQVDTSLETVPIEERA